MGIARKTYETIDVGNSGNMRCSSSLLSDLEAFQEIVAAFEALEDEGLIHITKKHKESSSGKRLIDLVTFLKLK